MTRSDLVKYVRLRREIGITAKAIVLSIYWRAQKANWVKIGGFSTILLGLQVLTNAMILHSNWMIVISMIFIGIGLKITR